MGYAMYQLHYLPGLVQIVLYPLYVVCGVAIYYSLMIALAATSVWLGRNQTLFDFWFYITNFSRYPMEIYQGPWGTPLRRVFTFCIPVLVVVNVPARILVRPVESAVARRLVSARLCPVCHGGQPGRLALGVSAGAGELSEREQLRGEGHPEATVILERRSS